MEILSIDGQRQISIVELSMRELAQIAPTNTRGIKDYAVGVETALDRVYDQAFTLVTRATLLDNDLREVINCARELRRNLRTTEKK